MPAPREIKSSPNFKAIFESVPGLFLVLDPDFKIVAVSDAYSKATMTTREWLLGKKIFEAFPGNSDDPSAVGVRNLKSSLARVVEKLKPDTMALQKYDIRKPSAEGGGFEKRYWSPVNSPVLDGQGKLTYIIHRVEDVTEMIRLRKEGAENKELQERFAAKEIIFQENQEIFDHAIGVIKNYAIIMLDAEGKILTWNKGAEMIKGYKASEIIGRSFACFYTPEDRSQRRPQELLRAAVRDGRVEDEGWRVKKDGTRFLADVLITALKSEKGELRGFIKVTRDVTEVRKNQRELKEKTQLLDSVLRNIGEGVVVANEKGEFLMFNEAAERIVGLGPMAGGPDHWAEQYGVFRPDGTMPFPADENPMVKAIRGEATNDIEVLLRNSANPKGVLVSITGRPIKDEKGEIRGGVVVIHDITELKHRQELETYNRALEVSNKELQDFVFVASHDLQEPLRKVLSFGEFLQEEYGAKLEETGRDYLDRIRSAASRMQTLINDLLTLTRVTTKAKPFEPVELDTVLKEVLSDLEVRISEKKARVEVGPLPKIEADATQMRQLFQNLIGNALKFHRPGVVPEIKVEAAAPERGAAGSQCRIGIKDNGIGFDNKYAGQIFKVFERLHGRDEYEGTGIGLAVCRKVVERHNGAIAAEGFPGQGSTFTICLPLRQNFKGGK